MIQSRPRQAILLFTFMLLHRDIEILQLNAMHMQEWDHENIGIDQHIFKKNLQCEAMEVPTLHTHTQPQSISYSNQFLKILYLFLFWHFV